jgi:hypothetical protein
MRSAGADEQSERERHDMFHGSFLLGREVYAAEDERHVSVTLDSSHLPSLPAQTCYRRAVVGDFFGGAKVVTLMVDSGLKYLSTDVYRRG